MLIVKDSKDKIEMIISMQNLVCFDFAIMESYSYYVDSKQVDCHIDKSNLAHDKVTSLLLPNDKAINDIILPMQ